MLVGSTRELAGALKRSENLSLLLEALTSLSLLLINRSEHKC
jgi:hypothetical protein